MSGRTILILATVHALAIGVMCYHTFATCREITAEFQAKRAPCALGETPGTVPLYSVDDGETWLDVPCKKRLEAM